MARGSTGSGSGGGGGAVSSVAGKTGAVSLVKGDVGLSNVDNTADTAKPVSTAAQTALDTKAPLASPTFTGTVSGVSKAAVGLGNVDNTADVSKPVSTAQQAALDAKQSLSNVTLRRQVATRASFPSSARLFTNSSSNTQVQQTMSIQITDDSEDFVFTWGNFNRPSPSSTALSGLSTITVRAGLYDGVNTYPIFWPNGSRDMVLEPGAWADSRPVMYKAVKGQRMLLVWRITWATAPASFPGSCTIANYSVDVSEWGTALTDRTTNYASNTMFTRQAGNYAVLPPIGITATGKARPVVGILGDSISSDSVNDFTSDSIDTGWAAGGLGDAGIPYVQLGTSSLLMTNIASSTVLRSQLFTAIAAAKVTHLLLPLGTNDWASGRTAAAVLADANTIRNDLKPLGVKVIPITLQPKTDSTNTTNASGETNTFAQRALYNAAIISGNGLGDGYYDLASITQSTANNNLWRTDLRTLSGVPTIATGGTGYTQNDVFELPGGVTTTAVTVASGVVTALSSLSGTGLGGFVVAPTGTTQTAVRQYPGAIRAAGVTGTGLTLTYPADAAATPTPDGTHPSAATTRWIRQNFAVAAPALFTV